jgi:hypothetical protein
LATAFTGHSGSRCVRALSAGVPSFTSP